MKIYNAIVVWDVYVVVDDKDEPMDALAAAEALIKSGELEPSEGNALQVRDPKAIRSKWIDEKPIVGSNVADADFDQLKGKTTMEIYKMLHTKPQTEAK